MAVQTVLEGLEGDGQERVRRAPWARQAAALAAATLLLAPAAPAKAPRTADIDPGTGMAGVRIGQYAAVVDRGPDDQIVRGRRTRSFGRVHRFCLEGDQCAWKVRGGGFLTLALDALDDEVIALSTNARGWATPEGIARGSTAGDVEAAYPGARKRTRCVPPAGAEVTGYLLRDAAADTFFEIGGGRVERIHVVDRVRRCG